MDRSRHGERLEELWTIVRQIPVGMCAGYGEVGRALSNPVSGYLAGKWMASCPEDVPWWRVVKKDGSFAVGKRDPSLEIEQKRLLRLEGVKIVDDRVDMHEHGWNHFS